MSKIAVVGYHLEKFALMGNANDQNRMGHATIGARTFARVSRECPASVAAQAALIAIDCNKVGSYSPLLLRFALLSEPRLVRQLVDAARINHRNNPKAAAANIEYSEMTRIINEDFGLAQRMRILDTKRLGKIAFIEYEQYGSEFAIEHLAKLYTELKLNS